MAKCTFFYLFLLLVSFTFCIVYIYILWRGQNKAIQNNNKTRTGLEIHQRYIFLLPYIKGRTNKLGRILIEHDIEAIFKGDKRISGVLSTPKDRIWIA